MPITTVDLSTYIRVGRYDLPEPTRTTAPTNNLLAQEVSAVTYNWDTDTLFMIGDGSKSIVQVSKTGQLIDTMTLALGTSPQGTEFYDTEGLTYIGGGKFVLMEERDRQANSFTYAAGTTLARSNVQTVKLGDTVGNIGIEGISYDPQTSGYIAVKEITPLGIFQTNIDFAAGTATNGSATTVNSIDLFNPALVGVADFADVFALSNLTALNGQADSGNLLVLSQESGKIVEVDRSGTIKSLLTIFGDADNPLNVADQQHEGLTMDNNGFLYVVSENGGSASTTNADIPNHPQLWVYAPSTVPNQAPTAVALNNPVNAIVENTSTATRIKVADIAITDDQLGVNNLTVTGADANFFEIAGNALYLKAGTILDYETKTSYGVTVNVDDTTVGGTPDATTAFTLAVTDVVNEVPPVTIGTIFVTEVAPWSSGNSAVGADWFELTNTSANAINITGWKFDDSSNSFAAAIALNGITSIEAGESVIFIETPAAAAANPATLNASFRSNWFGTTPPASLRIGNYTGDNGGLSTGGDAVNIYNASGVLQANVVFRVSPTGPFATFNNAALLNNATISTLSAAGTNGAFSVVNGTVTEIGSPGSIGTTLISPKTRNDFNSDKKSDILWRNDNGSVAIWRMDGTNVLSASLTSIPGVAESWKIGGTGDFNNDQKSDILWRNDNGNVAIWQMDGSTVVSSNLTSVPTADNSWKIAGTGDFNNDQKSDILWRNDNGSVAIWQMDGTNVTSSSLTSIPAAANSWKIAGTGDFNNDQKSDILWRNDNGSVAIWQMNGINVLSADLTSVSARDNSWKIAETGDFNGDSKSDILWRNDIGSVEIWQMNGSNVIANNPTSIASADTSWKVAAPIL
jgi:uncharacterized protein YjiK